MQLVPMEEDSLPLIDTAEDVVTKMRPMSAVNARAMLDVKVIETARTAHLMVFPSRTWARRRSPSSLKRTDI